MDTQADRAQRPGEGAPEVQTPADAEHPHELPWGALLLTILFLLLITVLWVQIYLDLLQRGVL